MKVWLRLYPSDWRKQYGAELEALLEDRRLSLLDVWDLLRGAMDAWRHPISVEPEPRTHRRWRMNLTVGRCAGMILLLGTGASGLFYREGAQRHGWMGPGQVQGDTAFLALMWGLILLGLAGLWLHARRTGHTSRLGEISLALGVAGHLVFVRDSGILPGIGPWPVGDDLGLLGLALLLLSVMLQGVAAIAVRVLPLWSTLPFALAPLLSAGLLTLGVGFPADPLRGPGDLLYFSISWLLLGCGLLLSPHAARQRSALE
jgi:hypothetical protein